MSKMIQLRNVPDALHRSLKARAAMAGMSLSDYLLAEIKEIEQRPTLAELRERLHRRKPVSGPLDSARLLREERDSRCLWSMLRQRSSGSCRHPRDNAFDKHTAWGKESLHPPHLSDVEVAHALWRLVREGVGRARPG